MRGEPKKTRPVPTHSLSWQQSSKLLASPAYDLHSYLRKIWCQGFSSVGKKWSASELSTGQYLWSGSWTYQVVEAEKDSLQKTRDWKRALTEVPSRGMKKYEISLPLKYNNGKEIEAEKIKRIREELIAAFGALTVSS
jgi:hypothetical protein